MAAQLRNRLNTSTWWLLGLGGVAAAGLSGSWIANLGLSLVSLAVLATDARQVKNNSGLRLFLNLALWILAIRLLFRVVFASGFQGPFLVHLPLVTVTTFAGEVQLLGPLSEASLESGLTDGLKLAAIVLCVGVASTLANPRRLLQRAPAAFYELATAIAIAANLAPQMVTSYSRIERAQRLRAAKPGLRSRGTVVTAVLEDAFAMSLNLAASMESRGFGRRVSYSPKVRRAIVVANLAAILMLGVGTVSLIDGWGQTWLALSSLLTGLLFFGLSAKLHGTSMVRTRYLVEETSALDVAFRVLAAVLPLAAWAGQSGLANWWT